MKVFATTASSHLSLQYISAMSAFGDSFMFQVDFLVIFGITTPSNLDDPAAIHTRLPGGWLVEVGSSSRTSTSPIEVPLTAEYALHHLVVVWVGDLGSSLMGAS